MSLVGWFVSRTEDDGTIPVRAFDLPLSGLLSQDTQETLRRQMHEHAELKRRCPIRTFEDVAAAREFHATYYYPALIEKHRARYPVTIESATIAGVAAEIFTPAKGIAAENQQRILINLHSGAFVAGARWASQIESIPIAAVGQIKVVGIDYRLAPEHRFPAASEDVAAVYRELLKTFDPRSIGIYGCSAGALLTAQALAWFQKEGLPAPGAAGMFSAAASYWGEGDTGHFYAALSGFDLSHIVSIRANPYLKDADSNDPLVFPARSPEVLSKFPPALLVSSTRDLALSSVAHTHSCLIEQGVKADLHVWDGLDHAFHYCPDLPQSRHLYDIVVGFFDTHLSP